MTRSSTAITRFTSFVVAATLLAISTQAHASGRVCREESSTIGYSQCHRFGAWSYKLTLWPEVGAAFVRYAPGLIDASGSVRGADGYSEQHLHAAPFDHRAVTAVGGRIRELVGGDRWYAGVDMLVADLTSGPVLVTDAAARGAQPLTIPTAGALAGASLFAGVRTRRGILTCAAELGPGVLVAMYSAPSHVQIAPSQIFGTLEARPKLDLWLTPHISIGVDAAVDVLHPGVVELGLVLGAHPFPYD